MKYSKVIVMLICLSGAIVAMEPKVPGGISQAQTSLPPNPFENLPDEVMLHVLAELIDTPTIEEAFTNIHRAAQVNRKFNQLLSDPRFTNYIITTINNKFSGNVDDKKLTALGLNTPASKAWLQENAPQWEWHTSPEAQQLINIAAASGDTETVNAFLQIGVDPNIQNEDGITPLIAATFNGHIETMNALLQGGANPNIQNANGNTLLVWAATTGHTTIVKALLQAGADPNIKNNEGQIALNLASKPEIKKLLQAAQAMQLTK